MPPPTTTEADVQPVQPAADPRRGLMILVAIGLALELVVAAIVFTAPRPGRFGWQMYSAVPYIPAAWAVVDGTEQPLDVADMLVNSRAEIDFVAFVRERACAMAGADELRIELNDGSFEQVDCP
jgi:hypothetical protein